MIRVMHLVEVGADFQTERGAMQLALGAGPEFQVEVKTIGPAGDWAGVVAAARGIRTMAGVDVVHAWGNKSLTAAAMGGKGGIVYSPRPDLRRSEARWLSAILQYKDVEVVAPGATLRNALLRAGVSIDNCHLIRPGVDFGRIRRKNARIRDALGFKDTQVVLLASGESTPGANHRLSAWVMAILAAMDPKWKLLLWGRGPRVKQVQEFARRVFRGEMMVVAEQACGRFEYEELLGACDMVVSTARGPIATLPLAMAMAGGVPIVSTVTYAASELLEDRHNALLVTKPSARVLAQKVLELSEDGGMKWKLTDMGKTEAFDYFALTRFVEQWRAVYRQVAAGEKVAVVEKAGAGARFHGRI